MLLSFGGCRGLVLVPFIPRYGSLRDTIPDTIPSSQESILPFCPYHCSPQR